MRERYLKVMLAVPFAASVLGASEAAAAPSACDAIAGNLVKNCGFETLTDWSPSVVQVGFPHTGLEADALGDGLASTIQQTISTMVGDTYTLSFWIATFVPPFTLDVSFGGTVVATPSFSDPAYEAFTTTVTASSTSSVLSFDVRFDVSSGYGAIDDVSLVLASPTPAPEPASLALLGTGLAGLAGLRRRRR